MKLQHSEFQLNISQVDPELWKIVQNLDFQLGMKTLDVGGTDNELSSLLEQHGCESWVIDLRPYQYPLRKFIQGNFHDVQVPENYFDLAFDISAIHHFGVEHYTPKEQPDDDIKAYQKVHLSLKSGGVFYLCMDRFKREYAETDFFHQYNLPTFKERVCKNFTVLDLQTLDVNLNPVTDEPSLEIVYAKLGKP